MIAWSYARKSSEDERTNEDGRSVARQFEGCGVQAAKLSAVVPPEREYGDDGISGAEFVNRPGLQKLLADLKRGPAPKYLIISEPSRLGREQIETAYVLKQITDAGVRVFGYLDGREIQMGTSQDKLMFSVQAMAAESERERGKQRTRDALVRKFKRGHWTGQPVFGYRPVRVGEHSELVIDEQQAATVRRIFELCAAGYGDLKIVQTLNDGKSKDWVRGVLSNRIYIGDPIYGTSRAVEKGGSLGRERVPQDDWIHVDADVRESVEKRLRIVSPETWAGVQKIRAANRAKYLRKPDGTLKGKPESVSTARFVASAIGRCHACGGPLGATAKNPKTGHRYYCVHHMTKGTCPNGVGLSAADLDAAIIDRLMSFPANDEVIDYLTEGICRAAKADAERPDVRANLEAEVAKLEAAVERLTDAVEAGQPVGDRLKLRTSELEAVKAKLAEPVALDLNRDVIAERLAQIPLANGDPLQARQILRLIGVDKLTVNTSTSEFSGDADFSGVVGWRSGGGHRGPLRLSTRARRPRADRARRI